MRLSDFLCAAFLALCILIPLFQYLAGWTA